MSSANRVWPVTLARASTRRRGIPITLGFCAALSTSRTGLSTNSSETHPVVPLDSGMLFTSGGFVFWIA